MFRLIAPSFIIMHISRSVSVLHQMRLLISHLRQPSQIPPKTSYAVPTVRTQNALYCREQAESDAFGESVGTVLIVQFLHTGISNGHLNT